jgi:hypothetical protein
LPAAPEALNGCDAASVGCTDGRVDGGARVWDDAAWNFCVVDDISDIETFATGRRIREYRRLVKAYGRGRWRKRKGGARVD